MSLYDTLTTDIAAILADTAGPAEAVLHRTAAGVETELQAVFERIRSGEAMFADGASDQDLGILHAALADIPGGLALTDEFDIVPSAGGSAETWKILGVRNQSPAHYEIELMRSVRVRHSTAETELDRGRGASMVRRV